MRRSTPTATARRSEDGSYALPGRFALEIERIAGSPVFQDPASVVGLLNGSLSEMSKSLDAFYSQARTILVFGVGPVLLVIALIGHSADSLDREFIFGLTAVALVLSSIGGMLLVSPVRELYRVYISTAVHAPQLHIAAGLDSLPWLERVVAYVQTSEVDSNQALLDFWLENSHNIYRTLKNTIYLYGAAALIAAAVLGWIAVSQ